MLATIPAIIATVTTIISTAQMLVKAGQDAAPAIVLLKKLFTSENITDEELKAIQADNDALFKKIDSAVIPDETE